MKFSLFKNDKTTIKDEIILFLIIIVTVAIGGVLIVTKPTFWIIKERISIVFGVFVAMFGVMLIPSLIYRIKTNDK